MLGARLTAPELIYVAVFTCGERSASALKLLILFVFQVLKRESMLESLPMAAIVSVVSRDTHIIRPTCVRSS